MKVLVANCGSSSFKYQLFDMTNEQVLAKGLVERIGAGNGGTLTHESAGKQEVKRSISCPDHDVAIRAVTDVLVDPEVGAISSLDEIGTVGHRVVHGGEKFREATLIDNDVLEVIAEFCDLAPLHNPPNLAGIRSCRRFLPSVPHVAVFDTTFYVGMPRHAYMYAIPTDLYEKHSIRRYGFHGTSHRYVTAKALDMLAVAGVDRKSARIITCHLGNGCSMTASVGGQAIDTSMGMTPLEGLVMGTRSGDIDPAVVAVLCEKLGTTVDETVDFLNKKCGLAGVSGAGNDMRDILTACEVGNDRAELAVAIFCYRVRKYIGAYTAAMGGVDAVVFTAGIGEHLPVIRKRTWEGLGFLGAEIDDAANEALTGDRDIARPGSRTHLYVIATNEELMIAQDCQRVVQSMGN